MKKRKGFKFAPLSRKQRQVLNWWVEDSPVKDADGIIADGAIRSGKTLNMSLSFIVWAMENFNDENFGMCGKTQASLRRNVLKPLEKVLEGRGYKYEEHRGDSNIVITKGDISNTFYTFGGYDERSQDLVQGITLAGVFFDEVALMPESFVNQATGRCSVDGSKFWFNCNPGSPFHWFKMNWIDKRKEKNLLYLHFLLTDNLSLTERIRARYESMYTGVFYKRYILGLWVIAEGVIYDMFDDKKHVCEDMEPQGTTYVSCDYGTQNPTVFLLWSKIDGVWTAVREYYYGGRAHNKQKTDSEYADDLAEWLGDVKPKKIIVDPSAASFIAELRKRDYKVQKGKNDVLDGIRYTATMLTNEQLRLCKCCKETIKEFKVYVWDEKAALRGEDVPVKENDHGCDAVRYFTYTILAKGNPKLKTIKGGI